MKLLLCSEGFNTEESIVTCETLVGKSRANINVGIINEAYAVEHDNNLRWVLDNLNTVRDTFGGNLELVNLLALDPQVVQERLDRCDVIFVVGGHTDYLMKVFNQSGFSEILPVLLENKVYVGSSAGSMVLGQRLSTRAYEHIYHESNSYGILKYMGLVDVALMPHLDSPNFPNRKETLQTAVEHHPGVVYGLRDDTALVVDGKKVYTIGSDPLVFDGGILRKSVRE